eukprot:tig00020563_g11364.t1
MPQKHAFSPLVNEHVPKRPRNTPVVCTHHAPWQPTHGSTPTAAELLERLPDAVLCSVFSFLSTPDKARAAAVCTRWRGLAYSDSAGGIDLQLDFPDGTLAARWRELSPLLRDRFHCTRLTISGRPKRKSLERVVELCPRLTSLCFRDDCDEKMLVTVAKHCNELKTVTVHTDVVVHLYDALDAAFDANPLFLQDGSFITKLKTGGEEKYLGFTDRYALLPRLTKRPRLKFVYEASIYFFKFIDTNDTDPQPVAPETINGVAEATNLIVRGLILTGLPLDTFGMTADGLIGIITRGATSIDLDGELVDHPAWGRFVEACFPRLTCINAIQLSESSAARLIGQIGTHMRRAERLSFSFLSATTSLEEGRSLVSALEMIASSCRALQEVTLSWPRDSASAAQSLPLSDPELRGELTQVFSHVPTFSLAEHDSLVWPGAAA